MNPFSLPRPNIYSAEAKPWELTDSALVSYQEVDGERVPVESRYVLDEGTGRYGFEVGAGYDPAHPLVIDPDLAYSTFLGGTGLDSDRGIAVDSSDNACVTGESFGTTRTRRARGCSADEW